MRARLTSLFAAALLSTAGLVLLAPACDSGIGSTIDENADADGDGFARKDDCNDNDPDVHPGAEEPCSCDGEDDDCNGKIDDFDCPLVCYPPIDADGDGYEPPADCNDQDATIHPGAEEPCLCDTLDQDCSGDPQDFACDMICYADKDGDGFDEQTDCNDNNKGINPGAAEQCECDSVDQNCNGSTTDIPGGDCTITCTDADGDGYYAEGDDCDDSDKDVHPGATEPCACDAIDQDCSGDPIDFGCDAPVCADNDNDGVPEGPDCDDNDNTVKPSPDPEACACDGADNNCNGVVDDFDAACTKTCTYLPKDDPCTPGMEPACGTGLACCGMPATCVDKCVGAACDGGCPMP